MASFTAPMKVDPLLKEKFLALRDALASLTTEEAQAILEAARAQTTTPAPTAIEGHPVEAISNAVLPQPQPELDHLLNRPVPYGLVGLFSRLLDEAQVDPGRVRSALIQATKFL
jgi:hypothetical protein